MSFLGFLAFLSDQPWPWLIGAGALVALVIRWAKRKAETLE